MADRTRVTPRISITKLGEYLAASPIRRRAIVKDQKHPRDVIVGRYVGARKAIARWFAAGRDDTIVVAAIADLVSGEVETNWDIQDRDLSIMALERFLEVQGMPDLEDVTAEAGVHDAPKLLESGVEVSVRPEIVLRGTDRRGRPFVGAVKVYTGKDFPLDDDSGLAVATMVHQYVEQVLIRPGEIASIDHCLVVDVLAKRVFSAPRSFTRRRQLLAAACEEIALRWPTV